MVVAGGAAGGGGGSGAMHQVKAILPPSVFGSNAYAKNKNACATAGPEEGALSAPTTGIGPAN